MNTVEYIKTYQYFSLLNEKPLDLKILDYGCNYSSFLHSSNGKILPKNYTGLDVDKDVIDIGKEMYPCANFIFYDRYNIVYNKKGQRNLWPNITGNFKCIISYSVITHTTQDDMLEAIDWLYDKLDVGGKMFITYLDQSNTIAKNFFYKKRLKDYGFCDTIETDDYIYLINNKITKIPIEAQFFLLFYNNQYLSTLLSKYNFNLAKSPIPNYCFQDCIIIEK